jgi:hypothetical protein
MDSSTSPVPYLSVVAASRNDDHGGDPLIRTQIFINCFAQQCEKYRLPAELILVDWNPVPDRPGLAEVLKLPAEASFCQARIITVPAELHHRFKYAQRLPLFQMIAKNVGIRRARGKFILATNIDIIFSDELMAYIGKQQLDPKKLLRVDRYDIRSGISPTSTLEQILDYAWNHPVRSNHRLGPKPLVEHLYGHDGFKRQCDPDPEFCRGISSVEVISEDGIWTVRPDAKAPLGVLNTNACGDFTLLSRAGWDTIRGYAEFAAYSMNIDSLGVACAHYAGFEEISLLAPCVCFHIEHSLGSGWTPEGEKKLFSRLDQNQVLNPAWHVLEPLIDDIRSDKAPSALNTPDWGLARFNLPERSLLPGNMLPTDGLAVSPADYSGQEIISILPEFDLDQITLWQERRAMGGNINAAGLLPPLPPHAIQAFVSDLDGRYTEQDSLMFVRHLHQRTTLHFFLNNVLPGATLRIDPTHQVGVVEIYRMEVLDPATNQVIWSLDSTSATQLVHGGHSRPLPPSPGVPLRLVSSGDDPQLYFPPLPLEAKTYMLSLELSFQSHLGAPTW